MFEKKFKNYLKKNKEYFLAKKIKNEKKKKKKKKKRRREADAGFHISLHRMPCF
jgi:hypothetical protein